MGKAASQLTSIFHLSLSPGPLPTAWHHAFKASLLLQLRKTPSKICSEMCLQAHWVGEDQSSNPVFGGGAGGLFVTAVHGIKLEASCFTFSDRKSFPQFSDSPVVILFSTHNLLHFWSFSFPSPTSSWEDLPSMVGRGIVFSLHPFCCLFWPFIHTDIGSLWIYQHVLKLVRKKIFLLFIFVIHSGGHIRNNLDDSIAISICFVQSIHSTLNHGCFD